MTVSINKKNKSFFGPSVKFVSPDSGFISEKWGSNFSHKKTGGVSNGWLLRDQTFSAQLPHITNNIIIIM